MTYPIRQPPDNDTAWGSDVRDAIAGVNDHEDRVTALEDRTPTTITYAATITPNAATSDAGRVTAIGALTVLPPSNPADGRTYHLAVTASGADRAVTLDDAIRLAVDLVRALTVLQGCTASLLLRYDTGLSAWVLLGQTQTAPVSPSVVAATTASHSGIGTASAAMPTGTIAGNVMVALHCGDSTSTLAGLTAPAGWTQLGDGVASGANLVGTTKVWVKTAGASEAGPYAFAADDNSAVIVATIRGQGISTPQAAYADSGATGSTSVVAPSLTAAVANCLLLSGYADVNGYTLTPPGGQTTILTGTPGGQTTYALLASEVVAAGATGTRTATMSGSYKWTAASVLIPAAGS